MTEKENDKTPSKIREKDAAMKRLRRFTSSIARDLSLAILTIFIPHLKSFDRGRGK